MASSWHFYARRTEAGGLRHYYPSKVAVRCAGARDDSEIVDVRLTLDDNGPLYGWLPTDRDFPSMIFPNMTLVRVCFPYGIEAAIKAGQGRVVRLRAEEIV